MTDDPRGTRLLTHSRLSVNRQCQRKHFLMFELGLRRSGPVDKPLRMGTAFHTGNEQYDKLAPEIPDWQDRRDAVEYLMRRDYPAPNDYDGACEVEAIIAVARARFWRWQEDEKSITVLATEQSLSCDIVNPDTNRPTPSYRYGGKQDRWVSVAGRIAVEDYKTTSKSIEAGSDFWVQLAMSGQLTGYLWTAWQSGFAATFVLYDVTRKTNMQPAMIPTLDEENKRIVLDADGNRVFNKNGEPRQVGASDGSMTVLSTREDPLDYGHRVEQDCYSRPDFYFARQEVARTDQDILEWRQGLWQQQQQLGEARRLGRHFKNPEACFQHGRCPFIPLCYGGWDWASGEIPEGYERLDMIHPELAEVEGE